MFFTLFMALCLALSGNLAISDSRAAVLPAMSASTVAGWGWNGHGQVNIPAGLSNVTAIAAGFGHSLALVETFTLTDLTAQVNGMNIHHGIKNSLRAKLNAAQAAINAGDTATACAKLADFINECQAQSGKKLAVSQASQLIAGANKIRVSLGCQ
jgi:hypothetical protein